MFILLQPTSKLNPSITQGFRKNEDQFDYNKDADLFVCPAGHIAIRKGRQGKKNVGTNQVNTYYFDIIDGSDLILFQHIF